MSIGPQANHFLIGLGRDWKCGIWERYNEVETKGCGTGEV